jgi:hypothetical protein
VKSSLTVIGYPKPSRANTGHRLALYLQTRRASQNRRRNPEHATWRIDCRARLHVIAIARHSPQILGAAATTLAMRPIMEN